MKLLAIALLALAAGAAVAQVTLQEYPLPTGVGAHDVWADPAPGGPVWFSAQRSGELGRLDPQTGKVELIPLGSGSAPHGVSLGPDGAAWLTDGGQNAIVRVDAAQAMLRFDPATQQFETFKSSSATANVRQIHGRRGEIWTPESAADKLVVYRTR